MSFVEIWFYALNCVWLFVFILSCLYTVKLVFETIIVYLLKSGKVDLGKHGFLYLGLALSYIITYLIKI
jgi:hypothetical protein